MTQSTLTDQDLIKAAQILKRDGKQALAQAIRRQDQDSAQKAIRAISVAQYSGEPK